MVYQLMVKGALEVMSWMVITSSCLREYKYLKGDLAKTQLIWKNDCIPLFYIEVITYACPNSDAASTTYC